MSRVELTKWVRPLGALLAIAALAVGWPALGPGSRPAAAQEAGVIRDIRIEGNQRIEATTVISYLRLTAGDRFDGKRIDDSLKSLFGTGLFADVSMQRDGDVLVVKVVENPIINRLAFEGNRRISDEVLTGEVQLRPRKVYTRSIVQSDVARILEIYRRSGRFAARVEPKVIQLPQNRVDLVFEIDEGKLTGVQRITFIGNKAFSNGTLREVVQTKQSRWWRILATTDTYDPDRLSFDRELLRRHYIKNGYADFRVLSAVAELTPDRESFYITVTVEEGERYRFGKVTVESQLLGLDAEALYDVVTTEEDDWYNAEAVESTIQALTDAVGNLGYAFVDVQPDIQRNREQRTIDLVYRIGEGERVYVQRIDITGNVRTLDRVIRRNVRLAEGDAFNTAKMRRSRQLINNLSFFSDVEVSNEPGDAPDQTIVTIDVEEQSTGEVTFGGGFSTSEGPTGTVGIRERNLLGRAQDLGLNFTISGVSQQLDLSFTERYFLNRDVAAGFDIFRTTRDFQNTSFEREDLGFGLRVSYPIAENLAQNLRYTIKNEEIIPDGDAPLSIRQQAGERLTSVVGQGLNYDGLDDRLNPTKGRYARWNVNFAGLGGDKHFLMNSIEGGQYFPFWDDWVLSVIGQAGYIFSLDDGPVLISDRFFIGSTTFRGFASGGLGPRDVINDDALGGNVFYSGTVEMAFPLGLPNELGIRGRVFGIVGSLTDVDLSGPGIVDTGSLRGSLGFGVSWQSPFGPIRIDLSEALLKESFDETEIVSFGFGSSF